jgi:hypothetical protein
MRKSTYRMRPDRFLGLFALGLIVLGVAAVVWAFGGGDTAIAVIVVLGGLITLTGLWVLARPPVLARLDDDGVDVRRVRTRWADVEAAGKVETTQGPALSLRTTRADQTIVIPLRWLAASQAGRLTDEIDERLNAAHGYRKWDGTAGPGK